MLGALYKNKLFYINLYHLILTNESIDWSHVLIEFYGFENKLLYL